MNCEILIGEIYNKIIENLDLCKDEKNTVLDILHNSVKNYKIELKIDVKGDMNKILEYYYKDLVLSGLADNTIKNKRYFFNELNSYIHKRIEDITIYDLRGFISYKQQYVVASTLNNMISKIKAFFTWACDEDFISVNPSKKLKKVRTPIEVKKAITPIELENMRDNCDNHRDKAIMEFCLSTGLRVSEIREINISDLDFTNNRFTITGKGTKDRICFFTDKAKYHITKYIETRNDNNNALFVGLRKPHNRLSTRAIEKIIKKIKDKAEIEDKITPHSFRRTMATNMINKGADITTVQKILGHSNINTTLIYAQTSLDNVEYQYKKCVL